jgi:hypothetical protein
MATRAEIKEKLKKSLINKVLETEDSTVDNNIGTNFKITDVLLIEPKIVSPESIDKDDFEKAEEVDFEYAQIRISINSLNSVYYCNGNAKIKYINNDFEIDLTITRIYSK